MATDAQDMDTEAVEVAPLTNLAVVSAVAKAELDQQITTAHAFPRSIKKFRTQALELATLSEEVASECYFILPRGGKKIEGPSVRLSEIIQYAWRNNQAGAQVIDEGAEFVIAEGVFIDLEQMTKITVRVRRRITDSNNRRFNTDMIAVTGNAACSIARRNAIFAGIPKAFWSHVYDAAKETAKGTIQSLVANRTKVLDWLAKRGVHEKMVIEALGVAGIEEIGLDELVDIRGMITSIKDGTPIEVAFAPKNGATTSAGKPKTEPPKSKKRAETKPDSTPKSAAEPKAETTGSSSEGAKTASAAGSADAPIEPKDVVRIEDKASADGIPLNAVCAHFEVGSLKELKADQVNAAIAWLDSLNKGPTQ